MLLAELHGYKQYLGKSLNAIMHELKTKYRVRFKTGAIAFTIVSESVDYVYKLWIEDKAYELFISYAQANPSKHIAKIIGKVRELPFSLPGVPEGSKIKIVKIEKLTHITNHTIHMVITAAFNAIHDMTKSERQSLTFSKLASKSQEKIEFDTGDEELGGKCLKFMYDNREFFETYLKFTHMGEKEVGMRGDMHTDNIMMRGDEMVISDPLFDDNTPAEIISASDLLVKLDQILGKTK